MSDKRHGGEGEREVLVGRESDAMVASALVSSDWFTRGLTKSEPGIADRTSDPA